MAQQVEDAPQSAPELDEQEQQAAEERAAISAHVVFGAVNKEGEAELQRPTAGLAWSGLAAGLSMGFSFLSEALLQGFLPATSWRPLISSLGYSIGFLIVILGRQQLFTENTLTPILPLLARRTRGNLGNVLRLWVVVLAANLLGALLFALILQVADVWRPEVNSALHEIANESLAGSFGTIAIKGVFAGWLIATLVWLLPSAEAARVWVIIIITYIVSVGGFSHVIAGSIEGFYLALQGDVFWSQALFGYTLPTLLGNVVGGLTFVAALNYAQVVASKNLPS